MKDHTTIPVIDDLNIDPGVMEPSKKIRQIYDRLLKNWDDHGDTGERMCYENAKMFEAIFEYLDRLEVTPTKD